MWDLLLQHAIRRFHGSCWHRCATHRYRLDLHSHRWNGAEPTEIVRGSHPTNVAYCSIGSSCHLDSYHDKKGGVCVLDVDLSYCIARMEFHSPSLCFLAF